MSGLSISKCMRVGSRSVCAATGHSGYDLINSWANRVTQPRFLPLFTVLRMLYLVALLLVLPLSATGQAKAELTSCSDQRLPPINRLIDTALLHSLGAEMQSTLTYPADALPSHYIPDAMQVQRWYLSEASLPSGIIVRELSPWQRNKQYIIGGFCLILVELLFILEMLRQRTKRRKVETALAVSNDRFRLAIEACESMGWEWDLKSGRSAWFGDLQTVFGIPSDTFVGRTEDFYRYVHPEDRPLVATAVADAKQSRKPYAVEFRVVRRDGTVRWISARGRFYFGATGDPERMLGMAADITNRKAAEVAQRESQDEYRLLLDSTAKAKAALASVSRRLNEAQESERARIARELHDSVNVSRW